MPNDFSQKINIDDFTGIYRAIAEKANINGGSTLEGKEINLFYEAKNSMDKSKSIFQFDGKTYDAKGELYEGILPFVPEKNLSLKLFSWENPVDDFVEKAKEMKLNDAALKRVDEYIKAEKAEIAKRQQQYNKAVQKISNSWAETFCIKDKKEFNQFIEKLYDVARELNITETNHPYNPEKYPTKEDQIVDEMCGIFAQESRFSTKSVSPDKKYYGLFQFAQISLNDINQQIKHKVLDVKGLKLKPLTNIQDFTKLSRFEQLDYMITHVKNCKRYSGVLNEPISPKRVYAMLVDPWAGKENPSEKQKNLIEEKSGIIDKQHRVRDKKSPL
ncbi:hypothetical protein IKQ21_01310 [bacterium]|nr:hypothetical protein [bacterium]